MFYRPEHEEGNASTVSTLNDTSKQTKRKQRSHKNAAKVNSDVVDVSDIEKNISEDSFVVTPLPPLDKKKVRYAVSQETNKRFLVTLSVLKEIEFLIKTLGITSAEYRKNIIKPLERMVGGKINPKTRTVSNHKHTDEFQEGSQKGGSKNKVSSFSLPRKATENLKKLYAKLENEGNDISNIHYENGSISFIDSAKLVRLYFYTHNLKDPENNRHFRVDDYVESIFSNDKLELLYTKNGDRFVTQGQLQALASQLVGEIVK